MNKNNLDLARELLVKCVRISAQVEDMMDIMDKMLKSKAVDAGWALDIRGTLNSWRLTNYDVQKKIGNAYGTEFKAHYEEAVKKNKEFK